MVAVPVERAEGQALDGEVLHALALAVLGDNHTGVFDEEVNSRLVKWLPSTNCAVGI